MREETAGDIVKNNLDFTDEHTLYILTGANMGGKTTITQSVGQLFFMAQGGIYVPATKFEYVPIDSIYTHFPADEDKTLDLGRLIFNSVKKPSSGSDGKPISKIRMLDVSAGIGYDAAVCQMANTSGTKSFFNKIGIG